MATIEYWIQIENRPWDVCPRNIDRMWGQDLKTREGIAPVENVTLTSPHPLIAITRKVTMFKPLTDDNGVMDALILRRYKRPTPTGIPGPQIIVPAWTVPDDRKVNPWDLNEPDPTDSGTMGTIPGPVIDCNVGDKVIVHFRNMDMRVDTKGNKLPPLTRTHSLHPHGFAFLAAHDGAYPLSPQDKTQPVGSEEKPHWDRVDVTDFKKGDRVPPLGTFDYTWIAGAPSENDPETIEPWPTTAGVWLYHDHSVCDMDNVSLGAIGIIVIHNPNDPQDVDIRNLNDPTNPFPDPTFLPGGSATGPVTFLPKFMPVGVFGEYFPPPSKALYLQLFHQLTGLGDTGGMLINGRQYLGNTPTLIAGPETLMRFGVVAMGNDFHTFHIHGHRWAIPGPDGSDPDTIQNSAQIRAVSQFEDTRLLGPANSSVFSIQEGEFFGARDDDPTGEFHMHCHVLMHMDMGMMGSLLILPEGGGFFYGLPSGVPCPSDVIPPGPANGGKTHTVMIQDNKFDPDNNSDTKIHVGDTVKWMNMDPENHTVTSNPGPRQCSPKSTEHFDSPSLEKNATFKHRFKTKGSFAYHCEVHGCTMSGKVTVT